MSRKLTYERVCKIGAAKNCYAGGMSVKDIAKQAGVSVSTIRKWIKTGM